MPAEVGRRWTLRGRREAAEASPNIINEATKERAFINNRTSSSSLRAGLPHHLIQIALTPKAQPAPDGCARAWLDSAFVIIIITTRPDRLLAPRPFGFHPAFELTTSGRVA